MLKAHKFIMAIALSGVLGSNVLAGETVSSQAIYNSKTKALSLNGILVPFIDEFTGKVTDKKGIFDAQLQETKKLFFELNTQSIKLKSMFDGDDTSGYILYDYKTRSVSIPCFQVITIAILGDGIEGATIYYKDVSMRQQNIAEPIFHVEDMTETDSCESNVIPKPSTLKSCKSILDAGLSNGDGIYTIDPDGTGANPSFDVYCHNMEQDTPKEYLELKKIGDNYNYSLYKVGGATTGEDVVTHYTKIRINPETLIVDIKDTTFSSTTGKAYAKNQVYKTYSQYGIAADCIRSNSAQGKANIDLTGTPFKIHDNLIFDLTGWRPNGTSTIEANRQIVNTTGGGYCGQNVPMYNNEEVLKLDFL